MTDITLPSPQVGGRVTTVLVLVATILALAILASINWSAVVTKTDRTCEARQGPFNSGFSRGFATQSCE
jgi:hypothetical protein